jgi:hypothetical protein
MTRVRFAVCLAAFGVLAATAAPALADDGYTKICVNATNDHNNPGKAPICVWLPGDMAAQK